MENKEIPKIGQFVVAYGINGNPTFWGEIVTVGEKSVRIMDDKNTLQWDIARIKIYETKAEVKKIFDEYCNPSGDCV